jgi:universal stress protein A
MLIPKKILVPTDFSEYSDKALEQALDMAKHFNAKVYLFHAVDLDLHECMMDFCFSQEMLKEMNENMLQGARENMQKQLDRLPRSKEVEVSIDVGKGLPYEAILKEEKDKGIDLIVIGSLGRGGVVRYLMGSVSKNVVKGSHCPVLVVK